jgi:hypothetical protein
VWKHAEAVFRESYLLGKPTARPENDPGKTPHHCGKFRRDRMSRLVIEEADMALKLLSVSVLEPSADSHDDGHRRDAPRSLSSPAGIRL